MYVRVALLILVSATWLQLSAEEPAQPKVDVPKESESRAALVQRIRPSLVTIRVTDRNGEENGMGTGFVIDAAGLIATNFHVITEGRPFSVQLWPNRPLKVLAVEASDVLSDLAIIRVVPDEQGLVALKLGESDQIEQGADVLAFGNPLGLQHSVVAGVLSAKRDVEGQELLQLAMPVEFGNSGGPLVDSTGVVHGIVNMKSAVTENLGFAIPVKKLHTLLASPNPVLFERWTHLASLPLERWQPLFGANWRQRSGVISVSGTGDGFGGRALCLSKTEPPAVPFDLSAQVRLANEDGAAGLVFFADGADQHYGFYPSNGKLRLSCFRGPSVYSWDVLQEVSSGHYRPGEWNTLRVSVEAARIRCFVNGHLVIKSQDMTFRSGQVGLAKFRNTEAEFKSFRCSRPWSEQAVPEATLRWLKRLEKSPAEIDTMTQDGLDALLESSEVSAERVKDLAADLERRASQLQQLAADLKLAPIYRKLEQLLVSHDADDLVIGALLIAALDEPDLNVDDYLQKIHAMAEEVRKSFPEDASESQKLDRLDNYLFVENGFHGGRQEYYHPANSHLSRVVDDREGLPITLAILYMEMGRQLGLTIQGIGLPGHFVVKHVPAEGEGQLIDVFDRGTRLTLSDARQMTLNFSQRLLQEQDLEAQSPRQILTRVLRNLIGSAQRQEDGDALLRYVDALVAIAPEEAPYRLMRAALRQQTGRTQLAREDLNWLEQQAGDTISPNDLEQLRALMDQAAE